MPNITGRSGNTTNVYLNRDPIEATLPVQAIQTTVNDPIIISLKGLSGIGASNANKIIKVNSAGDALIYADEGASNWTLSGSLYNSNLYPLSTYTNVLIGTTTNPNGHGMFLLDKELAIKTSSGGFTYYGLKIIYDTYTVNNYVNNGGYMYWFGAQGYNFDKQLIIDTQGNGNELSNGTYTYTLPNWTGGMLALETQIPTTNNQLTNGAGFITASSTDTLTNKSISYSQLTGTPTVITNNTQIVNGRGFITPTSTDTLTNKSISYSQITGTPTIPTNTNQLVNGAGFITTSNVWTVSGNNIYTTGAGNVLMGITFNPNARKLYVNGDAEIVNDVYCNSSIQVGTTTNSNALITMKKASGASATIELDTNSRLRIGNNGVGDVSIYTNGNIFQVSNNVASNNNLVNIGSVIAEFKSSRTEVVELHTNKIQARNNTTNTILSNSSYGWEFRGTSTRYNISFPGGTYYPFLGTESSNPYFIHINNIGDAYQVSGTSTSNLTHKLLGQTIIDGASTNPALKMQTGSTVYCQMGRTSTFPTPNMGAWNNQTVPIGNAFYIGGSNTNDGEGFNLAMNGNTMMISNPGDSNTLRWYDEDGLVLGWQITPTGGITPGSDKRIKSEITTYKNSNFEKYKQIRTITYKKKIPDNINPKRLEKESCINKFNNIHFGIVAQEIYSLYPELEETQSIRDRKEYYYRKDNWDNEVYEKEHKEWEVEKEKFECEKQEEGKECCYNQKEPPKIFDEEEPMRTFGYDKLSILSIGVVQDLITENETQQEQINTLTTELDTYKSLMNKLINAKSFADFKKQI